MEFNIADLLLRSLEFFTIINSWWDKQKTRKWLLDIVIPLKQHYLGQQKLQAHQIFAVRRAAVRLVEEDGGISPRVAAGGQTALLHTRGTVWT